MMDTILTKVPTRNIRATASFHSNGDSSNRPCQGIGSDAVTLVFLIPSRPEIADRLALSGSQNDKDDYAESVQDNCSPYYSLDCSHGKDPKIEE
jgi:hypothetical protein